MAQMNSNGQLLENQQETHEIANPFTEEQLNCKNKKLRR